MTIRDQIVDLMKDQKYRTESEISVALDRRSSSVHRVLAELFNAGQVSKTALHPEGRIHYRLVGS